LVRLNKSGAQLESLSTSKYSIPPQNNLTSIPYIADFTIIPELNSNFNNRLLIAVSIPGGSLHFFFLQPGAGTIEWVLQAICESPASTVIAAIAHPLFMTIFSIDGWMYPITKKVSGSWGIFVQRLLLKAYLSAIAITPPDSSIGIGDKVQFKAKGKDNSGNDMDVKVTWSASGGEINPETGEYTATEEGDFTIIGTDSSYGISGTATVHVTATGVSTTKILPTQFSLSQNYPNPFNPTTTFEFSVKERCLVLLEIYDIRGRNIATLVSQEHHPGIYRVNFDAQKLGSGVYFSKIKMKDFVAVKKMVLLE